MARCAICGSGGILSRISDTGICGSCEPKTLPHIREHAKLIADGLRRAEDSRSLQGTMSLLSKVRLSLTELSHLEQRGVLFAESSPRQTLQDFPNMANEIVRGTVARVVDAEVHKANEAKTLSAKNRALDRALACIEAAANEVTLDCLVTGPLSIPVDPFLAQRALVDMRRFEYDFYAAIGKARKAEADGKTERAITLYLDALNKIDEAEETIRLIMEPEREERAAHVASISTKFLNQMLKYAHEQCMAGKELAALRKYRAAYAFISGNPIILGAERERHVWIASRVQDITNARFDNIIEAVNKSLAKNARDQAGKKLQAAYRLLTEDETTKARESERIAWLEGQIRALQ